MACRKSNRASAPERVISSLQKERTADYFKSQFQPIHMSGFTSHDISVLRTLHSSIPQGIVLKSEKKELKKFLERNQSMICQRLTSKTGISCLCIRDYMHAILTNSEYDRFNELINQGNTDPNDVNCHIFVYGMVVLLLTHAQYLDVLREAGIIVELRQESLAGFQVGDNGTYWRRRNLSETV